MVARIIKELFIGPKFDIGCTLEISHTFESLHAHLALDDGTRIDPGDEVIVHGSPIEVPYGEIQEFRRVATVKKAGRIEQAWTRMTGDLEFMELCEFSFSERTAL